MATQLIAALGHDLGGEVIPAAEDNPGGYWEHRAVVENHDDFFRAIGHSWSSPLPLDPGVFSGEAASRARKRIREIFEADFRDKERWVLKDPRLCRLLPLWDDIVALKTLKVRFAHVIRSPIATAASLETRDGMRLEASLVLWLRHVMEAERATRDRNRLWIATEELASNTAAQVSRLADWLGREPRLTGTEITNLAGTIFRPENLHHTQDNNDPKLQDFPWVTDVSRELFSWAETENPSGRTTLDRVFDEISTADRLLIGHPLAAHQSSQREERVALRQEVENFHQSLTVLRDEVAVHRQESDHLRESVTTLHEEVATHRVEGDHLRSLVGELQHMIARVENKHTELLSRSLDFTREIEQKHLNQTEDLKEVQEEARRFLAELENLRTARARLEQENHDLKEHLNLFEEEIRSKDSEINRSDHHVTNLEEEICARDTEIVQAGRHITSVEAELARTLADKKALDAAHDHLVQLNADLHLQLEEMEQDKHSTQEALENMANQLSWRVTAPLRKIRGLFPAKASTPPTGHRRR